MFPEVISPDIANHDKGNDPVTKEDPGKKAQDIIAFIGCFQLQNTIDDQGEHQKDRHPERRTVKPQTDRGDQKPDPHPGTSGADGKLFSPKEKRAIRAAMTAENNRQPFIEKPFHRSLCHTADEGEEEVKNKTDQSTNTRFFRGHGFVAFPYKIKDKTNEGEAETENCPTEAAAVNGSLLRSLLILRLRLLISGLLGSRLLSGAAFGTKSGVVCQFFTAIAAIFHN